MNSLVDEGLSNYGLVDKSLASAGLMGFFPKNQESGPTGNVWILEYNIVPQPAAAHGIWTSTGIWKSTSVWYA